METIVDKKRAKRISDEFALYMTDRLAKENVPLSEGLIAISMAICNIVSTTADCISGTNKLAVIQKFKETLDEYM